MSNPQQRAIGNYPEPDKSSIHTTYFLSSITVLFLNHTWQVAFTLQEETFMEFNIYISVIDTWYSRVYLLLYIL